MNREIKNVGEYLEVNADALLSNAEAMENAQIVVVSKSRIELAGDEKETFLERVRYLLLKHTAEIKDFSEAQKCDFLVRKMLLGSDAIQPLVVLPPLPEQAKSAVSDSGFAGYK